MFTRDRLQNAVIRVYQELGPDIWGWSYTPTPEEFADVICDLIAGGALDDEVLHAEWRALTTRERAAMLRKAGP